MGRRQAELFVVVRFIARRVVQNYPIYFSDSLKGVISYEVGHYKSKIFHAHFSCLF